MYQVHQMVYQVHQVLVLDSQSEDVSKISCRTTNENEMGRFAKLLLRLPGEILLINPPVANPRNVHPAQNCVKLGPETAFPSHFWS